MFVHGIVCERPQELWSSGCAVLGQEAAGVTCAYSVCECVCVIICFDTTHSQQPAFARLPVCMEGAIHVSGGVFYSGLQVRSNMVAPALERFLQQHKQHVHNRACSWSSKPHPDAGRVPTSTQAPSAPWGGGSNLWCWSNMLHLHTSLAGLRL
eukprot:scaffold6059_cov22-Tisochrysis_lutea.AAC.3